MAGFRRDDPYRSGDGYPMPVARDGNNVKEVAEHPADYNGDVECGHTCYINSKTGMPEDKPEY